MSNPDASAGPYAGNEKKPIGGNIMAHASTTRHVFLYMLHYSQLTLLIACNLRKPEVTPVRAKSTIRLVCQKWKRTLLFWPVVSATLRRKPRLHNLHHLYCNCNNTSNDNPAQPPSCLWNKLTSYSTAVALVILFFTTLFRLNGVIWLSGLYVPYANSRVMIFALVLLIISLSLFTSLGLTSAISAIR